MTDEAHEPHTPQIWPRPKTGEPILSRRSFIRRTVQLAVAGAVIPGAMSQLLPAVAPDALGGGGVGPVIKRDPVTKAKIPITLDDLAGDPPVVVTAEWNYLPAVVYKVKRAILEGSARTRGYNTAQYAVQHPDEPEHAIMVYEGKCKHLGCTVGFDKTFGASKDVPDYDEDGTNDGRILCPCHQGQYDIHDLAYNQPATPPPAPLNVIEFDVRDHTDDAGTSTPKAIVGISKYEQNSRGEAAGAGTYPASSADGQPWSLETFAIRAAGWAE